LSGNNFNEWWLSSSVEKGIDEGPDFLDISDDWSSSVSLFVNIGSDEWWGSSVLNKISEEVLSFFCGDDSELDVLGLV
jgi:hypothetical protein